MKRMTPLIALGLAIGLQLQGCTTFPTSIAETKSMLSGLTKKPDTQESYTSDKPVVMFILDTSGSMSEAEADTTRLQTAKTSIIDTISQIDKSRYNTSLITFSEKRACKADMVVAPSNQNPDTVVNRIDAIEPRGKTPLAKALQLSGEVLENIDKKMVILFSDGVETCNGDPVAAAKVLHEQYGININLQVIGYAVAGSAQQQLKAISEVNPSWKYHQADDAKALTRAINEITQQGNLLDPLWKDINTSSFQFGSGSTVLSNAYLEKIEKIFEYLKNNEKRIKITGHTDAIGNAKRNLQLSIERAKIVKGKLVELGIQADRIEATGQGEAEPLASNDNESGRQQNRRVVISVL